MSSPNTTATNSLIRWTPQVGPEVRALLDSAPHLGEEGRTQLIAEATRVLSKCVPPNNSPEGETGLAIGFVQSGKTLNFTTVAALARDNGFPLIIVITGTSVPLFNQSNQRLVQDLGIGTRRGARRWRHFPNPRDADLDALRGVIDSWRPGSIVPEIRRQAAIVTVMKHYRRLDRLNDLLLELELDDIPALVIDDEADQAGLNNEVNQQRQSATYNSFAYAQIKAAPPYLPSVHCHATGAVAYKYH